MYHELRLEGVGGPRIHVWGALVQGWGESLLDCRFLHNFLLLLQPMVSHLVFLCTVFRDFRHREQGLLCSTTILPLSVVFVTARFITNWRVVLAEVGVDLYTYFWQLWAMALDVVLSD
jgi:hypothetical protein